jgi:hypothetical protein
MKSITFCHRFAPGDLKQYRETALRLDDLVKERSPVADEILLCLTAEQVLTFERLNFNIVTKVAKLAFTILIGDAAQRAIACRPPCLCDRSGFCYREQLAAIAPRLQHNAECMLPVLKALHKESTRRRDAAGSQGTC